MADARGRTLGVLYLIGRDRPGILQAASAFVSDCGGTTLEGISHTLRSEAVVVLVVSGSGSQLNSVADGASTLGESLGLLALFTRMEGEGSSRARDLLPLTLRMSSPDFVGLISTMTRFLAKHQLAIIAHHTHRATLPYSDGMSTFRHKFTVLMPAEFKRKAFLSELDELVEREKFIRDDISHSDYY